MTYDGLPHVSLLSYPEIRDRVILLDGWSKTYAMTGWRMGFSVWPKPLYDKVRKLAVNAWSCVNAPAQYAGLAALTGPQDSVGRDGRRVRQAPEDRGRGAEQAPRRLLHHAEGRLLRLPQHLQDRPEGEAARLDSCSRRPASPPSAAPISASSARAISAFLRQLGGEHPQGDRADQRVPGKAATSGVDDFRRFRLRCVLALARGSLRAAAHQQQLVDHGVGRLLDRLRSGPASTGASSFIIER